jgi:hypothetical protein
MCIRVMVYSWFEGFNCEWEDCWGGNVSWL